MSRWIFAAIAAFALPRWHTLRSGAGLETSNQLEPRRRPWDCENTTRNAISGGTREPRGSTKTRRGWLYVIQKHDASRLHYDFRLQLGDVLLSWAVPKGPSLDPTIKRLAMHVEDHPVDYGGFEGIIPEGEYGGGTVMLWDRGHWEPEGDPAESYRQGKLKFRLFGEKLRGEWHLIRTGGHRAGERAWLLFKVKDEFARPDSEYDVTAAMSDSVKSGRTLAEIAKAEDAVWSSNRIDAETKRTAHQAAAKTLSRSARCKSKRPRRTKTEAAKKESCKEHHAPPKDEPEIYSQRRQGNRSTHPLNEWRSLLICLAQSRKFFRGRRPHPSAARHTRQTGASRRTMAARDQVRRVPNGRSQGRPASRVL